MHHLRVKSIVGNAVLLSLPYQIISLTCQLMYMGNVTNIVKQIGELMLLT